MNWWSGTLTRLALGLLTAALSYVTACTGRTPLLGDLGDDTAGGSAGTANGGTSVGGASVGGASLGGTSVGGATSDGGTSAGGRGGAGASGGRSGAGGTRGGTAGAGGAPEGGEGGEGGDAGHGGSPDGCRTLDEVFATDRASLQALRDVCAITWVLHIRGNVDDLLPLSNLVRLASVDIVETNLTSLNGLENVTALDGLLVQSNPLLSDLSALRNVTRASSVSIEFNARLEHVDGLAGLRELSRLTVMSNPALVSLEGLENVIGRPSEIFVQIANNDALTNLDGLDGLPADALYVTDNDVLTDIEGASTAASINSLGIWGNASLPNLNGLETLVEAWYFYVSDNPALRDISALQNLTAVRGEFELRNNDALANVHGFENLAFGGNMLIANNDALENLDGLSGLTELFRTFPDGSLLINANLALRRLRGMTALERMTGRLSITNNPVLPTCEAEWLRDHVGTSNIGLEPVIQGNDSAATCPP